ncbi:AraC family transcriptional regulator [cyanobacterium TDX16]|nr:AraC family transcriptional regulator [cyanobacterium TDX16]
MNSNRLLESQEFHTVDIDSLIENARMVGFQKFLLQSHPLLSKVFEFIEARYCDSISLREVAEAVGRSPAYLTDLVRRETGKTVLSWIVERRMAEARCLLLETGQSVEQISEAVGYFDRRHFSRLFLRFHGLTPQAWRRKYQSRSVPLLQVDLKEEKPSNLIEQRAKTITAVEAQRLQVCIQEIVEILYQNITIGQENLNEAFL